MFSFKRLSQVALAVRLTRLVVVALLFSIELLTIRSVVAEPGTVGSVERLDPAFDKLLPAEAKLEVIGSGDTWCEGPVGVSDDVNHAHRQMRRIDESLAAVERAAHRTTAGIDPATRSIVISRIFGTVPSGVS